MRNSWIIYLLSGFFLILSFYFVIPDLSKDLANYKKYEGFYDSAKTKIIDRPQLKGKQTAEVLVLKTQDGETWIFDKQYSKFWNFLKNRNLKGKKCVFYSRRAHRKNPNRVEINGKIIYDLDEIDSYKYFMLVLTFVSIIMSIMLFRLNRLRKLNSKN